MWAWPPFSLAPLVTTFYPNVTLTQCIYAFVGCTVVGLIAAVIPWRLRPSRHEPVSLAPDSNQRPPDMRRSGGARSCGTAASCGAPHARRRPSARRSPSRARSAFSFSGVTSSSSGVTSSSRLSSWHSSSFRSPPLTDPGSGRSVPRRPGTREPGDSEAEHLAELRRVPSGDRYTSRDGVSVMRYREPLNPWSISLIRRRLTRNLRWTRRKPLPSSCCSRLSSPCAWLAAALIGGQPDDIAVRLGVPDLRQGEQHEAVLPRAMTRPGSGPGCRCRGSRRLKPPGGSGASGSPSGAAESEQRPIIWARLIDGGERDRQHVSRNGAKMRRPGPVRVVTGAGGPPAVPARRVRGPGRPSAGGDRPAMPGRRAEQADPPRRSR